MTFITLSDSGYRDVSLVFDNGTLELEAEGESIQFSPRMLRQLADFIERELNKESAS